MAKPVAENTEFCFISFEAKKLETIENLLELGHKGRLYNLTVESGKILGHSCMAKKF